MIYFFCFFSIVLLGLFEVIGVSKRNSYFFLLIGLLLVWLLQSFRWTTGTDWYPYWTFFANTHTFSAYFDTQFEVGYSFFNYLIGCFFRNYTFFLAIYSLLLMYLYKKAAINNSPYLILILLFFYSTTIFPVRQNLACAFIVCSYYYIIKNNFSYFLLFVLLATSIHRTAIIFLPFFFIARFKFSNKILISIYLLGLLGGMSGLVLDKALELFLRFNIGVEGVWMEKTKAYLLVAADESISSVNFFMSVISNFVWIALFLYYRKKVNSFSYNVFLNIYIFGLFFNRLFIQSIPELTRISLFFIASFAFLYALVLLEFRVKKRILLYILFSLYCYGQMNNILYGKYSDLFLPFVSVFSDIERSVY